MSTQTYDQTAARIDAEKGEILAHALPHEALSITADSKKLGKNKSDTVKYRRWLPYGASSTSATTINQIVVDADAHRTQEGIVPDADTLEKQDITVQLNEYACLYKYTNKAADMYEDDIMAAEKEQTGERMALVREMILWGAVKGCTNKFYAGGTTRATVDETISHTALRNVVRSLTTNGAKRVNRALDGSPNFNTSPISASYVAYAHTHMSHDIMELPGFTKVAEYGSMKPIHENEIGAVDDVRFVISKELKPIADSGAAVGTTGLMSTSGSNIDIYPVVIVGKNAYADVALRGKESFDIKHTPHTMINQANPLGQIGYIGAIFYSAAFIQNDGWMAVIECGATDL